MSFSQPSPQGAPSLLHLAQGVARSFALSLKVLPASLRAPVTLAYLLARASDAIADSATDPVQTDTGWAHRLQALDDLGQAIVQCASPEGHDGLELSAVMALIAELPDPREQQLLRALPDLLSALSGQIAADRTRIAEVCQEIVSGQRLDLTRFGRAGSTLSALAHAGDLQDYTWRVAGCVGVFWTRMCEAHLTDWRKAEPGPMLHAAGEYGMALQRLNILRDSAADLRMGRCYWPESELQSVGVTPEQWALMVTQGIASELARTQILQKRSVDQIRAGLGLGLAYCQAIRPWRLRWASALPALIGLRTLQVIEAQGPVALTRSVKVERRWVRRLLLRLVLGGGTPAGLQKLGCELGLEPDACALSAHDVTIRS